MELRIDISNPIMIGSEAGKIEWSIKKDDFLSGKFDDATFDIGIDTWSLSSNDVNPLQGDTVSLSLSCEYEPDSILYSWWHCYGIICLKGLGGKFNVIKPWDWHLDIRDVQLKVDNSVFSFDEKYLFPDGTYRIEFTIEQHWSFVDFSSSDHALILGPSDAGCLQIEGKKLFVSKSYFSAQSPYFKALFFGDFKEKNQGVVVLNDVKFNTFKEFLAHLYTEFHDVRDEGAVITEVLALADMFLCNAVTRSCESLLAAKDSFTIVDLQLADKYRLPRLRSKALAHLPISELKKYLAQILDSPESFYTRLFIIERIEEETST